MLDHICSAPVLVLAITVSGALYSGVAAFHLYFILFNFFVLLFAGSGYDRGDLTGYDFNAVEEFRKLCGPLNPEIARKLRPNTLRAVFGGEDMAHNAVHCTDLFDDGEMECRYMLETVGKL
jgi:hypothetical protein